MRGELFEQIPTQGIRRGKPDVRVVCRSRRYFPTLNHGDAPWTRKRRSDRLHEETQEIPADAGRIILPFAVLRDILISMKRSLLIGLVLGGVCFGEPPKSPQATQALSEYQKAADAADLVCKTAKLAADKRLIVKLNAALIVSTKSGNLEEANAISAQIKEANARIEELSSSGTPVVEYTVWRVRWANGDEKYWIYPDGTVKEKNGTTAKWTKEGNKMFIDWSNYHNVFTINGKNVSGKGVGDNMIFTVEVIGTNLTGAESLQQALDRQSSARSK